MPLASSGLKQAGLSDIADRLDAGERLTLADGVRLFDSPDLLTLGWLANREREKRHGDRAYYNYNIHLTGGDRAWLVHLFWGFLMHHLGIPVILY